MKQQEATVAIVILGALVIDEWTVQYNNAFTWVHSTSYDSTLSHSMLWPLTFQVMSLNDLQYPSLQRFSNNVSYR